MIHELFNSLVDASTTFHENKSDSYDIDINYTLRTLPYLTDYMKRKPFNITDSGSKHLNPEKVDKSEISNVYDFDMITAFIIYNLINYTDSSILEFLYYSKDVIDILKEFNLDPSQSLHTKQKFIYENCQKFSYNAKILLLVDQFGILREIINKDADPLNLKSCGKIQDYFTWMYFVVEKLKGTDYCLELSINYMLENNHIDIYKEYDECLNLKLNNCLPISNKDELKKHFDSLFS